MIIISMMMCIVSTLLLGLTHSLLFASILISLVGFGTMFYFAPTFSVVPRTVDEKYAGTVFGVFNSISFGASAISPAIFGYILDNTNSYELSYPFLSIIATIGLVAALLIKKFKFYN